MMNSTQQTIDKRACCNQWQELSLLFQISYLCMCNETYLLNLDGKVNRLNHESSQ